MRTLLLACGLCCFVSAPVFAQEPDGRKVIENAVKAQGGEKSLEKLRASMGKAKGKLFIAEQEMDMTVQVWSQLPDKVKTVVNLNFGGMDMDIISVFNGTKGWKNISGELTDMEKDEIAETLEDLYVEGISSLYRITADKGLTFTSLCESKVGDKTVVGVKVSKKDKPDVKLYFDKETNLLLKSEHRGHEPVTNMEVNQQKLFSDYQEVAPSLKSAKKIVIMHDDVRFMEFTMLEESYVDRHDEKIFARPGQPAIGHEWPSLATALLQVPAPCANWSVW